MAEVVVQGRQAAVGGRDGDPELDDRRRARLLSAIGASSGQAEAPTGAPVEADGSGDRSGVGSEPTFRPPLPLAPQPSRKIGGDARPLQGRALASAGTGTFELASGSLEHRL